MKKSDRSWGAWGMKAALAGALLGASWGWVGDARASELCNGRECWPDFECTTEVSSCPPEEPDCEPVVDTWCKSPDCAAGEACPEGMRCLVADSSCRPNHEFPCETTSDCGPGFRCEPLETCDCSANADGSRSACPCEAPPVKYCAFDVTACSVETESADCAPGFRCADNGEGLCANPGDPHTGCNPGEPAFACVPPFFEGITTNGLSGDDAAGDGESVDAAFDSREDDGCSMAMRPASSGAAWLFALVLSAVARRERRVSSRR
jgi:hypothetical protein